jgi:3-phosphoshikimate 1-carboxyvinyltransferase
VRAVNRACRVRIGGGKPLCGESALPSDREVAQRALALAVLARGETRIALDPESDAPAVLGLALQHTLEVLRALGGRIEQEGNSLRVLGRGRRGLTAPTGALNAGSSPTTLAIAVGILSGQRFGTRVAFDGGGLDPCAPMVEALRARGAMISSNQHAHGSRTHSSVAVAPLVDDEALGAIEHVLRAPSDAVKTAILLSGLFARGPTAVGEPLLSADHTERWLTAMGLPLRRFGSMAGFDPAEWRGELTALGEVRLPGDATLGSALCVLASAIPGSRIALDDIGINTTRSGVFDALRLGGARLDVEQHGDGRAGHEPVARLAIESSRTRGGALDGELLLRAGAAAPLLLLLAPSAQRDVRVHDAPLLAALHPAPFARLAALLDAFGMPSHVVSEGSEHAALHVRAGVAPRAVHLRDPIALELSLLALGAALIAKGESTFEQLPDLDDHWPGLLGVLRRLGADITVEAP